MSATEGTTWNVDAVDKVTDGDTLRLVRSRVTQLGDGDFRVTDVTSKPIRLVWVNTPEKRDRPGWENARADLTAWLQRAQARGPLRVVCYESAGWDRLLGDLIDVDGSSASQWLMTERGWPPYRDGQTARAGEAALNPATTTGEGATR